MNRATQTSLILTALACITAESALSQSSRKKRLRDPAMPAISKFIKKSKIKRKRAGWKTNLPQPPVAEFNDGLDYYWTLETNKGVIDIKLMPDVAPMHVTSTLYLTKLGFYDGIKFHRVIKGFMAQGGCPNGDGGGGPGYKYDGECSPTVLHDTPGLLSMANAGPGTDGSQFFLTFVPTPHLDGKHTIFGRIEDPAGLEVLKQLEAGGSKLGETTENLEIVEAVVRSEPRPIDELSHASDGDDPALTAMRVFIDKQKIDKTKRRWKTKLAMPPKLEFTKGQKYFWNLLTSEGKIRVELMPDVAPMHVSNTLYLARLGFYDNLTFHRVIPGFMAQGGCPTGTGTGNPGYAFDGECDASAKHDQVGVLSAAHAGPGTDGSQFFLTFVRTPNLDGVHTVYGRVVDGLDTLKTLERYGTSPRGKPKKPLKILQTTISLR